MKKILAVLLMVVSLGGCKTTPRVIQDVPAQPAEAEFGADEIGDWSIFHRERNPFFQRRPVEVNDQIDRRRTVHEITCKPILSGVRVRDSTRKGWHRESWLYLNGVMIRNQQFRRDGTDSQLNLDKSLVYTFKVTRIESFASITFALLSVEEDGEIIYTAN